MKRGIFAGAMLLASVFIMSGQTTREEMAADLNKTGGVYFAYPSKEALSTPAPEGYKPFHISHYGRHGSRYLISDNDYKRVKELLDKAHAAGALTPTGEEMRGKLNILMEEAGGRGGDLSPLGRRQHRGIAGRMMANYPEVFDSTTSITARSTLVPRCIISMASFCERLKEEKPELYIDFESSNRYMPYLCHSIPESDNFNNDEGFKKAADEFEKNHTNPDRLVNAIFSDSAFVEKEVNPHDFIWWIYWLASDAQNTEGKIDFYKYLTPEELFDLWQCFNASFYSRHSNYEAANGAHLRNAGNLLRNMMATAEEAISMENPSAALRFGHDGNIVPLTALMHIEGCDSMVNDPERFYETWCDWKVAPMAANVQMILFRNPAQPGKILVKFLHNEKEVRIPVKTSNFPYYDWEDVKEFYKPVTDAPND